MFNRYKNTEVKRHPNKKVRMYKSTIYPKIDKSESDIYIYAMAGDRLDLIAFDYYNDVTLWPVIAHVNNIGKGSLFVESGAQIRIPKNPEEFIDKLKEKNL